MTPAETSLLLAAGSGAVAAVVTETIRLVFPRTRIKQRVLQPIALTLAALGVVGWTHAQGTAADWSTTLPEVMGAWALAGAVVKRQAITRKRKDKLHPPAS